MDLFGIKEHDRKHEELERRVRRLIEQVAELSIDLGQTRVELRKMGLEVESKLSTAELDPSLLTINEGIKAARQKLAEARAAAEEQWGQFSDELAEAVEELREELSEEGD